MNVREFLDHHFLHYNAREVVRAAKAYEERILGNAQDHDHRVVTRNRASHVKGVRDVTLHYAQLLVRCGDRAWRASECRDLMAAFQQLTEDGPTRCSRGSNDEDVHDSGPFSGTFYVLTDVFSDNMTQQEKIINAFWSRFLAH